MEVIVIEVVVDLRSVVTPHGHEEKTAYRAAIKCALRHTEAYGSVAGDYNYWIICGRPN